MLYKLPRSALSTVITAAGNISFILPPQRRRIRVSYIHENEGNVEIDFPALLMNTNLFSGYEYGYPIYRLWAIKEGAKGQILGAPYRIGNVNFDGRMCWGSNIYPKDGLAAASLYFEAPFNDHWLPEAARANIKKVPDINVIEVLKAFPFTVKGVAITLEELAEDIKVVHKSYVSTGDTTVGLGKSKHLSQIFLPRTDVNETTLADALNSFKEVAVDVCSLYNYAALLQPYINVTTQAPGISGPEFNSWYFGVGILFSNFMYVRSSIENYLTHGDPVAKKKKLVDTLRWKKEVVGCACFSCIEDTAKLQLAINAIEENKPVITLADFRTLSEEYLAKGAVKPGAQALVRDLIAKLGKTGAFAYYETYKPGNHRDITQDVFGGEFKGADGGDQYVVYPAGTNAIFYHPVGTDKSPHKHTYMQVLTEPLPKEVKDKVLSRRTVVAMATLIPGTDGHYHISFYGETFLLDKEGKLSHVKKEVKELPSEHGTGPVVRKEEEPGDNKAEAQAPAVKKHKRAARKEGVVEVPAGIP
jgi:hypothetical protein